MNYFIKILTYISFLSAIYSISLQEVYNESGPYLDYDKYIILEPNQIYTGGLGIYEGNIYINCSGSIIDLQEGTGIWVYAEEQIPSMLTIEQCTITNGEYYGLSFGGLSEGLVTNCNFIDTNFGLKLFDESNVDVTNSIFAYQDTYGIAVTTEQPILNTSYCLFWENQEADCMENCPGWGSVWTQLELQPGTGIIYDNPNFFDSENLNFELLDSSPCINSGDPTQTDIDGTISDIGAIPFNNQNCLTHGDLNNDNTVNILDIVELINCILYENGCSICYDINNDNEYNILDVLEIVNIITINNY